VRHISALIIAMVLWPGMAFARDLAIVANKDSQVKDLAWPELTRICRGEMGHWTDGKPVSLIIRDPGLPEMKQALDKLYGLSKEGVAALIVTANHGRANHPAIEIANSNEDLVKRVSATPGAIGIVDVYSITSNVSVIKISGKLPLEPGYLLHGN
jgi:ABC-type phosphate transport system substrate-binding protein